MLKKEKKMRGDWLREYGCVFVGDRLDNEEMM